jgi:rhodanese-related sulfurtransferase
MNLRAVLHMTDPRRWPRREAEALIRKAEARLVDYTHPDSYTLPTMPGGSKFMRNPPPPLEAVFPDGIPAEVHVASQTVEGVQVPQSATPQGYDKVLIVPYGKTAQ